MKEKISVGIVGFGNLGKGVALSLQQNPDFHLEAIFTRRNPSDVDGPVKAVSIDDIKSYQGQIDVMILCGGSATDLPEQGPQLATLFNTVDSFDTHAKIPEYFDKIDKAAKQAQCVSLISTGWDPGVFSLQRLFAEIALPHGREYTFWGTGVSQGHSDAIRRIAGVKDAVQYTVPREEAIEAIRRGESPEFSTREKHTRECYVVLEEGIDPDHVVQQIKNMPNYFSDYDTAVHFISLEELYASHKAMPHGGLVMRSGITGESTKQRMEFSLKLESNPEFTANILVAYARAVYRLAQQEQWGAKTVFDIPFGLLSPKTSEQLRKEIL